MSKQRLACRQALWGRARPPHRAARGVEQKARAPWPLGAEGSVDWRGGCPRGRRAAWRLGRFSEWTGVPRAVVGAGVGGLWESDRQERRHMGRAFL